MLNVFRQALEENTNPLRSSFSQSIMSAYYGARASKVALVIRNPAANAGNREMWVQSLGWEDPLEEGTATHSSILVWRIPWTEEPDGLQSMGLQRSDTTEATHTHSHECTMGQIQYDKNSLLMIPCL